LRVVNHRLTPLGAWVLRSHRTQQDIASELGISISHMSLLIAGLRKPSADLLIALSKLTGLPPTDLVIAREDR
jgi:transcriptional regulator with XRE-family HTH domain